MSSCCDESKKLNPIINVIPQESCDPDVLCITSTDGMPQDNPPVPKNDIIRYDPCSKDFWLYTCDGGWKKQGFTLCDLEELDTAAINDICDTLRIPAFYDQNGCCAQGYLDLNDLAEKLAVCLGVPPVADVSVAPGQTPSNVIVTLIGESNSLCPTPGITSAVWTLYDGTKTQIATGADLPGDVALPNLVAETGPFTITYQVTDSCGVSNIAIDSFNVGNVAPVAEVNAASGQEAANTIVNLIGTPNPLCPTQMITSAVWILYDGTNTQIATGTDLPGSVVMPDLSAETGPFTITYQVTDACGISNVANASFGGQGIIVEGVGTCDQVVKGITPDGEVILNDGTFVKRPFGGIRIADLLTEGVTGPQPGGEITREGTIDLTTVYDLDCETHLEILMGGITRNGNHTTPLDPTLEQTTISVWLSSNGVDYVRYLYIECGLDAFSKNWVSEKIWWPRPINDVIYWRVESTGLLDVIDATQIILRLGAIGRFTPA